MFYFVVVIKLVPIYIFFSSSDLDCKGLKMKKVLIVGSGITSALTSYLLRQKLLVDVIHITVWDKARGPGGRMSTSRSSKVPGCNVDLGLQYITTTSDLLQEHKDIYTPLIKERLMEPLRATILGYKSKRNNVVHYVTPLGSSSLVKYFLNQSKPDEIHYNTFLETIQKVDLNKIEAVSKEGKKEIFDIVVLSLPGPQASDLFARSLGEAFNMFKLSEEHAAIALVEYSERYAFAMYFDTKFDRPFDVKYFDDDDIVRYVSFDNVKRNRPDEPTGVCVHTTTEYYKSYEEGETPRSVIEMELLKKMRELFPKWPLPAETKLQTWKYSQVVEPHEDKKGYMKYNVKPLALCIGDSFVPQSNFDNCIYSAKQSVDVLVDEIKS